MTPILRLSLLICALFLSALSSADVNVSTSLKTTATYYSPGEKLPMVLTLKNTGTEGHTVSQIKTDWLSIEVMDIDEKQQKAFTAIAVSAEVKKSSRRHDNPLPVHSPKQPILTSRMRTWNPGWK